MFREDVTDEDITILEGDEIEYQDQTWIVKDVYPQRIGWNVTQDEQIAAWSVELKQKNGVRLQCVEISKLDLVNDD